MKRNPLFIFMIFAVLVMVFPDCLFAQSGLEGQISTTINNLVRVINILILGFIVWAGFLIAKGEASGMSRLIYGIIGLLVVNAAQMIIAYFRL